ncbi:MAG: hypothetical protein KFW09_02590 [Oscillospiraceae bacterium]|nr:hypothetical protein [Oscillospiraceae bacterium]
MFKNYFRKDISPSCEYCEYNKNNSKINDLKLLVVSCVKISNKKENDEFCNFFKYSPLKRIPKHSMRIKQYSKEDFSLE